jgi:hypothetical protein
MTSAELSQCRSESRYPNGKVFILIKHFSRKIWTNWKILKAWIWLAIEHWRHWIQPIRWWKTGVMATEEDEGRRPDDVTDHVLRLVNFESRRQGLISCSGMDICFFGGAGFGARFDHCFTCLKLKSSEHVECFIWKCYECQNPNFLVFNAQ